MRIPLSWLNEYVSLDGIAPRELADRLTFSGLEIEGIETIGADYTGCVAAAVTAVRPHPRADKLRLVTVSRGAEPPLEVVCGAPNVTVGMKVALAAVGAVLPGGLAIRAATIRGVKSEGMLCAADELGLSDDHSGLLALPDDTPPGTPLSRVLGPPETVLVAEVTPNRPDCLSLLGIAREVGALLERPVVRPSVDGPESGAPAAARIGVTIEEPDRCPRYTARLLTGLAVGPSPDWMRRRLQAAGIRAISNVVDITNYVMLECGHPLHAFDLRRLRGERIVVRCARPDETMKTLDGVTRALTPGMLVISDAERAVALAGIMGGEESGIAPDTAEVLLESACFEPAGIRRTSKTLGLSSESSYRFERGADPIGADWAGRRAAALLVAHAGAALAPGAIDCFPRPPAPREVTLRYGRARRLLGVPLEPATVKAIFTRLELPLAREDAASVTVTAPTFRPDLAQEADLVEEVARIHGLDRIPAPPPAVRLVPGASDQPVLARLEVSRRLAALGLTEILNYSFTSDRLIRLFAPVAESELARLPNPISAEQTVLRPSLIPQMAECLGRNRARQREDAALFEAGRVFRLDPAGAVVESDRVAIGLMGRIGREPMAMRAPARGEETFAWLKGIVEQAARALRLPSRRFGRLTLPAPAFEAADLPWAEPGTGARIRIDGAWCGVAGLLAESVAREWRLADPVALAELETTPLAAHVFDTPVAAPVAAHPSVERDVALIVPETMGHETILRAILKAAPPELRAIRLFDLFRGGAVGAGRKSVAYSLTYQADEKTLTDEAVNEYHTRIKAELVRELQAEIRE